MVAIRRKVSRATPGARRRPGATLAVASTAALITAIDNGVLTTAIPSLRADFGGSVGGLEWTTNAYNLAFGCLLIVAAGVGDRVGHRRVLTIGVALFGLASAGAALAPTIAALIVARALQGAGAAAILPLSLTVVSSAFPPEARGRAIGIWSGVMACGGVLGSVVSGVLIELTGWRGAFWINVPICIALVGLLRTAVAESHGPNRKLDAPGLVIAGLGCLGVASGLSGAADHGWSAPVVLGPLLAGCGLLTVFAWWERRVSEPVMPLELFRSRGFGTATLMVSSLWGSLALCVFLTSQYFQTAQGVTPLEAGLRFAIWSLPVALIPLIAGRLLARISRRVLIPAGMSLHTVGVAGLALVATPSTPYVHVAVLMVVSGIGLGLANGPVAAEAMSAAPPALLGMASGVTNTLRQLGGVLGIGVGMTVFAGSGGGYGGPADFTRGFVPALWTAALIAALGLTGSIAGRLSPTVTAEDGPLPAESRSASAPPRT